MPRIQASQMRSNWNGVIAACPGCGTTRDEHRPDCSKYPQPLLCEDCGAIRLPSERTPVWRYDPNTHTYHCPDHPKGTTP